MWFPLLVLALKWQTRGDERRFLKAFEAYLCDDLFWPIFMLPFHLYRQPLSEKMKKMWHPPPLHKPRCLYMFAYLARFFFLIMLFYFSVGIVCVFSLFPSQVLFWFCFLFFWLVALITKSILRRVASWSLWKYSLLIVRDNCNINK